LVRAGKYILFSAAKTIDKYGKIWYNIYRKKKRSKATMKRYYCPCSDDSCPYLTVCYCALADEGYNPLEECDDAAYSDPEGENWDDD
jgi:hypothetical protein